MFPRALAEYLFDKQLLGGASSRRLSRLSSCGGGAGSGGGNLQRNRKGSPSRWAAGF